jgi:hypothetical protein
VNQKKLGGEENEDQQASAAEYSRYLQDIALKRPIDRRPESY